MCYLPYLEIFFVKTSAMKYLSLQIYNNSLNPQGTDKLAEESLSSVPDLDFVFGSFDLLKIIVNSVCSFLKGKLFYNTSLLAGILIRDDTTHSFRGFLKNTDYYKNQWFSGPAVIISLYSFDSE